MRSPFRCRGPGRRSLAFAILGAALGCAAPPESVALTEDVDRFFQDRRAHIDAARTDLARRIRLPRVEHHPHGTTIIERVELMAPLEREFLAVRVTYLNDTDRTFDHVRLKFVVVDGHWRPRGSRSVDFVMPLDLRFHPGNSYCDEVHVPTGGAHESPGFDLRVEASAW